jgi:chitodextrinase
VDLSWNDNALGESGFELQRKAGNSADFATIKQVAPHPGVGGVTYTDSGLLANSTYSYRVRAVGPGGPSDFSEVATVVVAVVFPPSGLTSSQNPGTPDSAIDLTWLDNSEVESGFEVQRKAGTGDFATVTTLVAHAGRSTADPATGVHFTDSGLSPGILYQYRVRALNPGGASLFSGITSTVTAELPAPTDLQAVPQATQVTLSWSDNSGDESGFELQRKGGTAADFVVLRQVAAHNGTGRLSYVDSGLVMNTLYTYRVRATGPVAGSSSDFSNLAAVTTTPILGPSNLSVELRSGGTPAAFENHLHWVNHGSPNATLQLQRKVGAGDFAALANLAPTTDQYDDQGLAPNTLYSYRLRSAELDALSDYSNVASQQTPPAQLAASTLLVRPKKLSFTSQIQASGPRPRVAQVTLTNKGTVPLVIGNVLRDAKAQFDVSATGPTLLPGASANVPVTFKASRKGSFKGFLDITGTSLNGDALVTVSVPLHGTTHGKQDSERK